ncbi:hypothetical protein ACJMK2_041816 [Sinanodonta woodiana]|uniref:Counting factor associated protein D n=1 Tax=Sinanodonta woodiana TaxID=1069815 RepID=A0ABD3W5D7_SINWO
MRTIIAGVFLFAGVVLSYPQVNDEPPKWGDTYTVMGVLSLPYAEIQEPISCYYDAANKRSRIDYYEGMVVTILRADVDSFGVSYKLAPMTDYHVKNKLMCFQVNGTSDAPITVQGCLPDLTGFQKVGSDVVDGAACDTWQKVDMEGEKKNKYTMWVQSDNGQPIRYEMMGYDTLLGSHYDKYIIDYSGFDNTVKIPVTQFEVPSNMTCGGFPGPGVAEHHILMNPMKEYIHNSKEHVHEMFENFKNTHKSNYSSDKEHAQRKHIFSHNVRFIHSKNRQGLGYTLAVNHFADKSDSEMKHLRGYRYSPGDHGGLPFDKSKYNAKNMPDQFDWRLYGAVTQVKDQGVCGSCWSFGTAETIEGAYFLKTGTLVRLSQQELIDCSWGEGNNGCDGGEDFRSYMWIMKNGGLTSEEEYGQYLMEDGYCHSDKVKPVVNLKNYVNVTSGDLQALQFAIYNQGPISVAIDASHKSLSFYANGVYYEPKCGNKPDDLDHAVLAVGYGSLNGKAYWLIKNSWSTYWGNDGYVLMSQENNNCGVATNPTYVIL